MRTRIYVEDRRNKAQMSIRKVYQSIRMILRKIVPLKSSNGPKTIREKDVEKFVKETKICIFHKLSPPFGYGMPCEGAARSVLEIAKRLAKSNHVFIVNTNVNSFYDSKNDVFFIGTGIFVLLKKLSAVFSRRPLSGLYPWIRDTLIHVVIGLMKMPKKVDVFHATTPLAIMLKDFFGIRSKVNILHLHESPKFYKFLSSRLRSLFLKNITAVIAPSNYVKNEFVRLFHFDPNRIHVVHNGVDYEWFNCVDDNGKDESTVLFVGAIVPQKGLHYLLKAIKIVQEQIPGVKLRIVGAPSLWYMSPGYDHYFESVSKFAKKLPKVEFLGTKYGEELVRAYKTATIAVLPSIIEEANGLVVLEAMAAGLPVIVSRIGGLVEPVKKGRAGLLVPPRDSVALANSIVRLLKDENMRREIVRNADNVVKKCFRWDLSVNRLCEIYSRYLAFEKNVDSDQYASTESDIVGRLGKQS